MRSMRRRSASDSSAKQTPMPAIRRPEALLGGTTQRTSPTASMGLSLSGRVKRSRKEVPTSRGLSVRMNMPPTLMLAVTSSRKSSRLS